MGLVGIFGLRQGQGARRYPHELLDDTALVARARTSGKVTNVSPVWLKAPCASFSVKRKSSRTRCATIWNAATPSSSPRWRKFCAVYREVQVLKKAAAKAEEIEEAGRDRLLRREAWRSKAIATTAPDLPPVPGRHASLRGIMRSKRQPWHAQPVGRDRSAHRQGPRARPGSATAAASSSNSSSLLDAAYPASTAIKLILDNHSAHISRETRAWLDTRPAGRFDFTFTPKHGSLAQPDRRLLSLSSARSVLRAISE